MTQTHLNVRYRHIADISRGIAESLGRVPSFGSWNNLPKLWLQITRLPRSSRLRTNNQDSQSLPPNGR